MLRVTALTASRNTPSARFRVRQFIEPLAEYGIEVRERSSAATPWSHGGRPPWNRARIIAGWGWRLAAHAPGIAASRGSDVTLLSKSLLHGVPSAESLLGRPLVLDVDDAMWLATPLGLRTCVHAAHCASHVVVGNPYLRQWFQQHCDAVTVVPTVVDMAQYRPRAQSAEGRFVVGWIGSAATAPFVELVEPALRRFLRERPDAELLLVSDRFPSLASLPAAQVRTERWSPEREVELVQEMTIGLMPMPDTPWTRGKCAAKVVQYLACGRPSICSPVGVNLDLLGAADVGWGPEMSQDAWYEALAAAYEDRAATEAKGARGRALVESDYSLERATALWASVLKSLR